MRRCEKCERDGPVLWDGHLDHRYLCVRCHENPADPFFVREHAELHALANDVQAMPKRRAP